MEDLMIDIETMSTDETNALILSIGLLEFDPKTNECCEMGSDALFVLSIKEQLLMCRKVDTDTQKFWAKDDMKAARAHWYDAPESEMYPVVEACNHVSAFVQSMGAKRIWSNGIVFDIGNLSTLYRSVGLVPPWRYNSPRDVRTFCREVGTLRTPTKFLDKTKIPHHPVSDCQSQAAWVWASYPDVPEAPSVDGPSIPNLKELTK